jgi:hypothetical protein
MKTYGLPADELMCPIKLFFVGKGIGSLLPKPFWPWRNDRLEIAKCEANNAGDCRISFGLSVCVITVLFYAYERFWIPCPVLLFSCGAIFFVIIHVVRRQVKQFYCPYVVLWKCVLVNVFGYENFYLLTVEGLWKMNSNLQNAAKSSSFFQYPRKSLGKWVTDLQKAV